MPPLFSPRLSSPLALALLIAASVGTVSSPAHGRENLGLYSDWGAFRDPLIPRCYAIAMALPSTMQRDYQPYAAVGTWPKRGVRNQLHFRLSRKMAEKPGVSLRIGRQSFELTGGGGDAWPVDQTMNAAITSAMRSARQMTISATDAKGRRFANIWNLPGAASAMDAAALGCARLR
jgi:hypothetical protein